jgi:hypothetical protein
MVEVAGFDSSVLFTQISQTLSTGSASEKEAVIKKAKAIFQFDVKVIEINDRISRGRCNSGRWI